MELPIGTFTLKECSPAIRKRVFEILKENNVPISETSENAGDVINPEFPYLGWDEYDNIITEYEVPAEDYDNHLDHFEFLALFDLTHKEPNKEDFHRILAKTESEGFDYCFDGYSSWKDIDDPIFHDLRANYLKAKKELEQYIKRFAE